MLLCLLPFPLFLFYRSSCSLSSPLLFQEEGVQHTHLEADSLLSTRMASTISHNLISEPHLIDVIDDEWARDTLPDDGAPGRGPWRRRASSSLLSTGAACN